MRYKLVSWDSVISVQFLWLLVRVILLLLVKAASVEKNLIFIIWSNTDTFIFQHKCIWPADRHFPSHGAVLTRQFWSLTICRVMKKGHLCAQDHIFCTGPEHTVQCDMGWALQRRCWPHRSQSHLTRTERPVLAFASHCRARSRLLFKLHYITLNVM